MITTLIATAKIYETSEGKYQVVVEARDGNVFYSEVTSSRVGEFVSETITKVRKKISGLYRR